jgi:hypothetical protein
MTIFLWIILAFVLILGAVFLVFYLRHFVPLREKENGFKYVFVEEDGCVRELDQEEVKYLSEIFAPNDGARPYIKTRYSERTPDGKISGFILRRRIPKQIKILISSAYY